MKKFIPTLNSVQNAISIQNQVFMPICNLIIDCINQKQVYMAQNNITRLLFVQNKIYLFQENLVQLLSPNFGVITSVYLDFMPDIITISSNQTVLIQSQENYIELDENLIIKSSLLPQQSEILNKINETLFIYKQEKCILISQNQPMNQFPMLQKPILVAKYTNESVLFVLRQKFQIVQNCQVIAEKLILSPITSAALIANIITLGLQDGRTQEIDLLTLEILTETAVQSALHDKINAISGPIIGINQNLLWTETLLFQVINRKITFYSEYHSNFAKISQNGILSQIFTPFSGNPYQIQNDYSFNLGKYIVCGKDNDFTVYNEKVIQKVYFDEKLSFISLFRLNLEIYIFAAGQSKFYIKEIGNRSLKEIIRGSNGQVQCVLGFNFNTFLVAFEREILFYQIDFSQDIRLIKVIKTQFTIQKLILHPKQVILAFFDNGECCIYLTQNNEFYSSNNTTFDLIEKKCICLDNTGLFLAYLQENQIIFKKTISLESLIIQEAIGAQQLGFSDDNKLVYGGEFGFIIIDLPDAVYQITENFNQNMISSCQTIEEIYNSYDMWVWE